MNSNPIILDPAPTCKPATIRFYRIKPTILHTGSFLYIADGVVEIDGQGAYLGQAHTDPDTGELLTVAAFVNANDYGYPAPLGWQADIITDPAPPPPDGGAALIPFPGAARMAERRAA